MICWYEHRVDFLFDDAVLGYTNNNLYSDMYVGMNIGYTTIVCIHFNRDVDRVNSLALLDHPNTDYSGYNFLRL